MTASLHLWWDGIHEEIPPLTRNLIELCISPDRPDLLQDIAGLIRSWKPPAYMLDYDPDTEDIWQEDSLPINNWWAEGEVRCQQQGCDAMIALLPVLFDNSYCEPGGVKTEENQLRPAGEPSASGWGFKD